MEQCSPFAWVSYNEDEGIVGELKQYLMQSRMELEATVMAAQEEIMKKEEELLNMKDLLMLAIKERDEAQSKVQTLTLEKLLLQQKLNHHQNTINPLNLNSSSNCSSEQSDQETSSINMSSPPISPAATATTPPPQLPPQILAAMAGNRRPLPEKGKLLKAVMGAGPLLQTLLLAGPLPQWQHPPPQLESIEIPPVRVINTTNPSNYSPNHKRGFDHIECSLVSSSSPPKYQRVV